MNMMNRRIRCQRIECVQRGGRTGRKRHMKLRTYVVPRVHSIVYMVDCCVNISNDPDTRGGSKDGTRLDMVHITHTVSLSP